MFEEIESKVINWFSIVKGFTEKPCYKSIDKGIKTQIEQMLLEMDDFISA